jgi:hypothetical protein
MEGWLKDNGYSTPQDVVCEDPQPRALISASPPPATSTDAAVKRQESSDAASFGASTRFAASLVGAFALFIAF